MKQALGDDVDIHVVGLNQQGGQYKKMGEKALLKFCSSLYQDNIKTIYEDYQAHTSNPVAWDTCPFPAGSNEVFNYALNNPEDVMPPYVPGGEKWKAEFRFSREGEILGGYNIYGIVRNEKSILGN